MQINFKLKTEKDVNDLAEVLTRIGSGVKAKDLYRAIWKRGIESVLIKGLKLEDFKYDKK